MFFKPGTLNKVRAARSLIDGSKKKRNIRLQVDGGICLENIKQVSEAGADMFVAGSAIFKTPRTIDSYKHTINRLKSNL